MLKTIWSEFDALAYTTLSIGIANVHETLSLFGLCVSITYAVLKIKYDFYDNRKNKNK